MLVPALGVRDEQLDGRRARGRVGIEQPQLAVVGRRRRRLARAARDERLERLAEHGREGRVEDVQQLGRRAEVGAQPAHPRRVELRAPLAEDLHVGVPEAVDRLELVADREQVPALERLEQVELQAVGVLELVDHQQREALAPAPPLRVVGQQVAHAELEVLEVDRRALGLAVRVLGGEAAQQLVEQPQRRARVVVGAGPPVGVPGRPVGLARLRGERLRARAELRRVQLAGRRHAAAGQRPRAGRERAAPLADADPVAGALQLGAPRPRARRPAPRPTAPGARPGSCSRGSAPRLRSVSCAPSTRSRRPWP